MIHGELSLVTGAHALRLRKARRRVLHLSFGATALLLLVALGSACSPTDNDHVSAVGGDAGTGNVGAFARGGAAGAGEYSNAARGGAAMVDAGSGGEPEGDAANASLAGGGSGNVVGGDAGAPGTEGSLAGAGAGSPTAAGGTGGASPDPFGGGGGGEASSGGAIGDGAGGATIGGSTATGGAAAGTSAGGTGAATNGAGGVSGAILGGACSIDKDCGDNASSCQGGSVRNTCVNAGDVCFSNADCPSNAVCNGYCRISTSQPGDGCSVAAPCGRAPDGSLMVCDATLHTCLAGSPTGDACLTDRDCAPKQACKKRQGLPSTCQAFGVQGADCADVPCADGYTCVPALHQCLKMGVGPCEVVSPVYRFPPCPSGMYCSMLAGRCVPVLHAGDACSGLFSCGDGLYCDRADTTPVCKQSPPLGSPCFDNSSSDEVDGAPCALGLFCDNDSCHAAGVADDTCEYNSDFCAADFDCVDGSCTARTIFGSDCSQAACADGLSCARAHDGGSCVSGGAGPASSEASSGAASDDSSGSASSSRPTLPLRATAIALSNDQTCALVDDGSVACWSGTNAASASVSISTLTHVTQLVAGDHHFCALSEGSVWCWGSNSRGELGNKTTSDSAAPVHVANLSQATFISAAASHTCAVRADAQVVCWGSSLGGADPAASSFPSMRNLSANPVLGLANTSRVTAGRNYNCAQLGDGSLRCWRASISLPAFPYREATLPNEIIDLTGAESVALGDWSGCATTSRNRPARCWQHANTAGLANVNGNAYDTDPSLDCNTADAVSMSAAGAFTCAAFGDGRVRCWATQAPAAKPLCGILRAKAIAVGAQRACAALADGGVQCWSLSLNNNSTVQAGSPYYVPGFGSGVTDAPQDCGSANPICKVSASAQPVAVSLNSPNLVLYDNGLVAARNFILGQSSPVWSILPYESIVAVANTIGSASIGYSLLRSDGTVQTSNGLLPLQGVSSISAGAYETCATLQTGGVACWSMYRNANDPVPLVAGVAGAERVSSGNGVDCAVLGSGAIQCWGDNSFGGLGNGSNAQTTDPVFVSGISTAVDVSAQQTHSCALLADGTLRCWGYNFDGELGDGLGTQSSVPVSVVGLANVTQVKVGSEHSCALRSDGTVWCWGRNSTGQLGDGTANSSLVPVQVLDVQGAISLSENALCAVLSDYSAKCWGGSSGSHATLYFSL